MNTWGIALAEAALIVFLVWICRRDAFKSGYEKGTKDQKKAEKESYQRGRTEEANWWIAAECEIVREIRKPRRSA